jgi:hypothetical protein
MGLKTLVHSVFKAFKAALKDFARVPSSGSNAVL